MDFNSKKYGVEYTEQCIEEMTEIYDYISEQLKNDEAAKRLISNVNEKVLELENLPEIYMKIGKVDRLKREYHKMVVGNYIVLYTIDDENKKVYVSRMLYGRKKY